MGRDVILSQLKYVADRGALEYQGVRYLLIRPETLAEVQRSLEVPLGQQQAGEILYQGGFTGGRLSGQKYKQTFGLSDREAVEFMCQMGGEIGWGWFRLIALDTDEGVLEVEVTHSPFAQSYGGRAVSGVCHLIRGVLGGLGEGIFGKPVTARERDCLALGDAVCRFEVRVIE